MKQKLFFLMLTLFVLGAASVNAQVRIGGTDTPHTSAVLDLNTTDDAGSTLGLALPRVALGGLDGDDAKLNSVNAAEGTVVYNTNGSVTDGKGLYVWNGTQWIYVAAPNTYPLSTIQVGIDTDLATSGSYSLASPTSWEIDTINIGTAIPLKLTLTPTTADATGFGWSVSGTGGKITGDGTVTGNYTGSITVRATSPNGLFAEKRLVVRNSGVIVPREIGNNTYNTYNYNGTVWMLEALKEGEDDGVNIKTSYNEGGNPDLGAGYPSAGERGYYYNWTAAQTACPEGWTLPSLSDWATLGNYLNGTTSTPIEKSGWFSTNTLGGYQQVSSGTWNFWGATGYIWLSAGMRGYWTGASATVNNPGSGVGYMMTLRCIESK
jgi:uncharacterized protein (TIGR02145 family)